MKASAVAPANPPIAEPPARVRTFLTFGFTTSEPRVTCPSAMTQTESPLRTQRTVVARAAEVEKGAEEAEDVEAVGVELSRKKEEVENFGR